MKNRKKAVRAATGIIFTATVMGLLLFWGTVTWEKIPSSMKIRAGEEQKLSLNVPVSGKVYRSGEAEEPEVIAASGFAINKSDPIDSLSIDLGKEVTVYAAQPNDYQMHLKLFGMIPFKTVDVEVIEDYQVTPVGMPIGIYVKTQGILVIDTGEFEGMDHTQKEPVKHLLQAEDYILKVDGEAVGGKKDFMEIVSKSEGREMVLTIRRGNEIFDVKVKPEKNSQGEYKLGIWIRDNAQGVGTMTFLDENNYFGALGHGINDTDTSTLMNLGSGSLYKTEIVSVTKGENGAPGELTGLIDYNLDNKIGSIEENCLEGIFGILTQDAADSIEKETVSIAFKQEIETGPAQVLCCIDGDGETKLYDINITAVHLDHDNVNRGIELEITDPELLEQTGGIVQGMSGSPILQNGKIIGAVTHVLVNDPTKGYGIFIENMLEHN